MVLVLLACVMVFEVFAALGNGFIAPELMMVELLGLRKEILVAFALIIELLFVVAPEMLMFEDALPKLLEELCIFIEVLIGFSCVLDCAYDSAHEKANIKARGIFFIFIQPFNFGLNELYLMVFN